MAEWLKNSVITVSYYKAIEGVLRFIKILKEVKKIILSKFLTSKKLFYLTKSLNLHEYHILSINDLQLKQVCFGASIVLCKHL
jgi:hypothetical protein